jgi:hypothetical protein
MTSASEFGIFGAAARIVLNGDTRPVVDGVGEAVVAGLSSNDDAALSGSLGDALCSSRAAACSTVRSKTPIAATWALAASTVPAATHTGGLRNVLTTKAASKRRMRWRLSSLAIVSSRRPQTRLRAL